MSEVCCGKPMEEEVKTHIFPYINTNLSATFPVFTCKTCGLAFYEEEGEDAKMDAINDYHKKKEGEK